MNGNNPLFNGSMMRLKEQQKGIESGQSSPVEIFFMWACKRNSFPYLASAAERTLFVLYLLEGGIGSLLVITANKEQLKFGKKGIFIFL